MTVFDILDALIDSATSGKPRLVKPHSGGRRVEIISTEGLRLLMPDLWPEALQRLVALDIVHPNAQMAFMRAWKRMQFEVGMTGVDFDLYFAALRKMLPCSYAKGGAKTVRLYRGQQKDDLVGSSWTNRRTVALQFALFGFEGPEDAPASKHGVILTADVPSSEIVSDLWTFHIGPGSEGEFIIDPRNIDYTSEPASEVEWIEHERETAELRKAVHRAKRKKH